MNKKRTPSKYIMINGRPKGGKSSLGQLPYPKEKYKRVDYGDWWIAGDHGPVFGNPEDAWDWIDENAAGGCWNVTRACPHCEIPLVYDKFRDEYFCPRCEPRG